MKLATWAVAIALLVGCSADDTTEQPPETGNDGSQCAPRPTAPWTAVPEPAQGPERPGAVLMQPVTDDVYWMTDGNYQVMFVTTGAGVVAIDAPYGPLSEDYRAQIATVTDEPVTHVIYSQGDIDHIGGAGRLGEDLIVVAHTEAAAELAREDLGEEAPPTPTMTFDDTLTLTVGDKTFDLAFWPNPDERGNISIHLAEQRVVMLVDVLWPGWVPFRNLSLGDDIPGNLAMLDRLADYDVDVIVGGHVTRPGTRADIAVQREFLVDLADRADALLADLSEDAVAGTAGTTTPWSTRDALLDAAGRCCAAEVTDTWSDRLGGADVFAFEHCRVFARGRLLANAPPSDVTVTPVSEHVWRLAGTHEQALVVAGTTGIALVDAPPALAKALPEALKNLAKNSLGKVTDTLAEAGAVTHLVYTDADESRVGGAAELLAELGDSAAVTVLAQQRTTEALGRRQTGAKAPTASFETSQVVDLGGVTLELSWPGASHGLGTTIVRVPEDGVLFTTGLFYPGTAPPRWLDHAHEASGVLAAIDYAAGLDFAIAVTGRAAPPVDRAAIEQQQDHAKALRAAAEQALAETPDESDTNETNPWAQTRAWLDEVAQRCATILRAQQPDLPDLDRVAEDNCWVMVETLAYD